MTMNRLPILVMNQENMQLVAHYPFESGAVRMAKLQKGGTGNGVVVAGIDDICIQVKYVFREEVARQR
jgi:hypothetical protein